MKQSSAATLLYVLLLILGSFYSTAQTDEWVQKSDFGDNAINVPEPTAAYGAVGFSIGSKGYVGTGNDGSFSSYRKDFWEYDPATDTWMQKADFRGPARQYAVGFSIGNKGYLGTGYSFDGKDRYYNDFWEYDPTTNTWTRKADFEGTARSSAIGFSIENKGYVGTGYSSDGTTKDFWEYNPATNTWKQKADFGGGYRSGAVGFGIGSKGYLGTGYDGLSNYSKDFWEYDPDANRWTRKTDFGGTARSGGVGFSIGNKGYISTGWDGIHPNPTTKDFWEYEPTVNTWMQKADFGGNGREEAVGFSIGSKGYIGTGFYPKVKNDFWQYNPAANDWMRKADFGGTSRAGAVGFSIGNKGYLGTGYSSKYSSIGTTNYFYKDFWEYDPVSNVWTQKANFGGSPRYGAVGFCIGSKGYIGTGYSYSPVGTTSYYYNDFWEYDPGANNWTQKADFGGKGRDGAVGFCIGGKGYIGTGYLGNRDTKDFWEYDPETNNWTKKANFGGSARSGAVGFSIGSKGYLGTGNYIGNNLKDFWEYDPATNNWRQKADFRGPARYMAVGFSVSSKGYIGTGYGDSVYNYFWEYDPATNTWIQRADFGGTPRGQAVGFSIGSKGYIGTGSDGGYRKDFWEYTPAGCPSPVNLLVSKLSDTCARLSWKATDTSVKQVKISYRPLGTVRWNEESKNATNTNIRICNLIPNTTYEWKVRNICADDKTAWVKGPNFTTTSSTFASSIAATSGNDKLSENISVQIMPNPNKGNFSLQMQLPAKAACTTLAIYNNLGAKVWQADAGRLSGSVNRNISLEDKLPAGLYMLLIQHGNERTIQKVIVMK